MPFWIFEMNQPHSPALPTQNQALLTPPKSPPPRPTSLTTKVFDNIEHTKQVQSSSLPSPFTTVDFDEVAYNGI